LKGIEAFKMLLNLVVSCCVIGAFALPNPQRLKSASESPGRNFHQKKISDDFLIDDRL
jgi:hypothetical protein